MKNNKAENLKDKSAGTLSANKAQGVPPKDWNSKTRQSESRRSGSGSKKGAATEGNRLGTMPVGQLIIAMSVPTMFSMLIQALYNIVDSIFVARFSEKALTAVSLAFPMQNLMISFAVGTSVGICSVISRRLGERREADANVAAETGFSIVLAFAVLFILTGLFTSGPFIRVYTHDPQLLEMGSIYLRICLSLSAGVFVSVFCEKSLQATGDTIHPMLIQAGGAIFNIIFDPILIFGKFGFPQMGVSGAAYATVAGQFFSMILGIVFLKKNTYLQFSLLHPRFRKDTARDIMAVGFPSIVMQGIGTLMTSLMNGILVSFDVLATTVFGVYFKLQSFVFMPVFGMNSGIMPILGFNYGARNRARIMQTLRIGLTFAILFMSAGAAVFFLFPDGLLGLFNASEKLLEIGRPALRTISFTFPLAAVSVILMSLFQATGDGYLSMIVSIVRQIFFLIPASWILGRVVGLEGVWIGYIVAEAAALTLTVVFYRKELKKLNF